MDDQGGLDQALADLPNRRRLSPYPATRVSIRWRRCWRVLLRKVVFQSCRGRQMLVFRFSGAVLLGLFRYSS